MENQPERKSPIKIGSIITVVVMAAVVAGYGFLNKMVFTRSQVTTDTAQTTKETMPNWLGDVAIKNRCLFGGRSHISPGGEEQMGVTLTFKDGLITDAQIKPMTDRPISLAMQDIFAQNFKQFVIGKNINEVHLTTEFIYFFINPRGL